MSKRSVSLFIGTRKGAFVYRSDSARKKWAIEGPHLLGVMVNHVVPDPRDGKTVLMAAKPGHLGPTVYRSGDGGRTWKEAAQPPAFPKGGKDSVKHVFWLSPGHLSQPGVWYAGTAPHGIFRSQDGGATWEGVKGFNEHPLRPKWSGDFDPANSPPDLPSTHSILVDPSNPDHLYVGFSCGGFFESTDAGADWKPLNKGIAATFLPEKDPEFGHDPHCVRLHPLQPSRLYQQNHCGFYRLDRPGTTWERVGNNMPKEIGDIGFPVVLHPRDPDTVWVFPMDGTEAWPRTSPGGRPAVYVSKNAGKTWKRQDKGLPRDKAWFTVKRQCFAADAEKPVGLYFGTTAGEIWSSRNEGKAWSLLTQYLPQITSVETGTPA